MRITDLHPGDLVRHVHYFRPYPFEVVDVRPAQRYGRSQRCAHLRPAPVDVAAQFADVTPWASADAVPQPATGQELEPWAEWWEANAGHVAAAAEARRASGRLLGALAAHDVTAVPATGYPHRVAVILTPTAAARLADVLGAR